MAKASEEVKAAETVQEKASEEVKAAETVQEKASEEVKAAETVQEKEAPRTPDPEDRVMITLFKDNERYKDPLLVAVNGRNFLIQRGVPVEVKRYVAEVIQNSLSQDNAAQLLMSQLAEEYEEATKAQK